MPIEQEEGWLVAELGHTWQRLIVKFKGDVCVFLHVKETTAGRYHVVGLVLGVLQ